MIFPAQNLGHAISQRNHKVFSFIYRDRVYFFYEKGIFSFPNFVLHVTNAESFTNQLEVCSIRQKNSEIQGVRGGGIEFPKTIERDVFSSQKGSSFQVKYRARHTGRS